MHLNELKADGFGGGFQIFAFALAVFLFVVLDSLADVSFAAGNSLEFHILGTLGSLVKYSPQRFTSLTASETLKRPTDKRPCQTSCEIQGHEARLSRPLPRGWCFEMETSALSWPFVPKAHAAPSLRVICVTCAFHFFGFSCFRSFCFRLPVLAPPSSPARFFPPGAGRGALRGFLPLAAHRSGLFW